MVLSLRYLLKRSTNCENLQIHRNFESTRAIQVHHACKEAQKQLFNEVPMLGVEIAPPESLAY